ncbi:MAG: membrane lipoprotein lipid attachment site-containing protein [Gillisia sp.]|nr:membrane lipoprotein lipid attachment site-containing protein [Gillisia sp.]
MKKILLLFTAIAILTSCTKKNDTPPLDGLYLHLIPNCYNSENPELNCLESLSFNDDYSANIRYGGADFRTRINYKRNVSNNTIIFTPDDGSNVIFSFTLKSDSELVRIQDNESWYKEE